MLLCVKQGFLEYQTLLISRVKRILKYKIILLSVKVSIYSDKKIQNCRRTAAELQNIGGNFLPPKIYQNCEDCVSRWDLGT
jgi:hypothetical protein